MQPQILHIIFFSFINLFIVSAGYLFIKGKSILAVWVMFVLSIIAVNFLFVSESPVIRMLAITCTTFTSMKVVTATESYKSKKLCLKFNQWAMFALGWAGMRAQPFETLGYKSLSNVWPLIRFGTSRIIAGLLLISFAHIVLSLNLNIKIEYALVSIILLIGFSLTIHFGLLNISAGVWRLQGVNVYSLFREPAKATSLTELWSRRWNLAFSEMTSIAVFRPLANRVGSGTALMLSFAFSGLLHELALSVPVNAGYGLPLLYFIIQGVMVLIEKLLIRRNITLLQHKVIGRIWTFFWLIAPMPLLFHVYFIKEVLWPLAALHVHL